MLIINVNTVFYILETISFLIKPFKNIKRYKTGFLTKDKT